MLAHFRDLEVFILDYGFDVNRESANEAVALVNALQEALVNQWARLQPTRRVPKVKISGIGIEGDSNEEDGDGSALKERKDFCEELGLSALNWP